jgi:bis(5'-nucleosyl)-tetraphosphatase (symmetrical)
MNKRTIFIGDVHGCFDELELLIKKINYAAKSDRLIFLGDLINKGPKSDEVVKYVQALKAEVILGNHELAYLKKENGKKDWQKWFATFPSFIEEEKFIAVHGGIAPGLKLNATPNKILTRLRTWDGSGNEVNSPAHLPWFFSYQENKPVFFGHWAALGLVQYKNVTGLDSGCAYGGELSAWILETKELVQVKAKKCYEESEAGFSLDLNWYKQKLQDFTKA